MFLFAEKEAAVLQYQQRHPAFFEPIYPCPPLLSQAILVASSSLEAQLTALLASSVQASQVINANGARRSR